MTGPEGKLTAITRGSYGGIYITRTFAVGSVRFPPIGLRVRFIAFPERL